MSTGIDLSGRRAVVTGGGGGIGGAISDALADAGAHVIVVEIDEGRGHDRVEAITTAGGSADALVADVLDRAQVEQAVTAATKAGPVDILVNNVGHYLRPTPFL